MEEDANHADRFSAALEALSSRLTAIEDLAKTLPEISTALSNMKADVAEGIKTGLQESLPMVLQEAMERVGGGLQSSSLGTETTRAVGAKSIEILPADFALMDKLAQPDQSTDHVLRWLQYMSCLSLLSHVPELSTWRTEENAPLLQSLSPVLNGVSGLALALFSVPNGDSKEMYAKTDGTAWTFVMRWVIAEVIQDGRRKHFANHPMMEPHWLRAFGNRRQTVAIINHRLKSFLDYHPRDPSSPVLKQRRTSSKACKDSRKAECDPEQALITRIRSRLLSTLSSTRRKVKLFLFRHIFFLFEQIRNFPSIAAARDAGFYVVYGTPEIESELCPSMAVTQSEKWDIPLALTYTSGKPLDTIDRQNQDALDKVMREFPSLTVSLFWRQTVTFSTNDPEKEHPDYNRPGLHWEAQSTIHLHRVVVHMLGELVRTEDARRVLRASPSSVRGIHCMALGLRAVMRDSHGLSLTETETACLGNVRLRMRDTNEEVVSILVPPLGATHRAAGSSQLGGQIRSSSDALPTARNLFARPLSSLNETDASAVNSVCSTPTSTPRKRASRSSRSPARNVDVTEIMQSKFSIPWSEYLGNLRDLEESQGADPPAAASCNTMLDSTSAGITGAGPDSLPAMTLMNDITDQIVDLVSGGSFY